MVGVLLAEPQYDGRGSACRTPDSTEVESHNGAQQASAPTRSSFMIFDPTVHHRKSIRLKGFDYSSPGYYFLTICTEFKIKLFGKVIHKTMNLNDLGRIVNSHWIDIPKRFPQVKLDYYMIMPNHMHSILIIEEPEITSIKRSTLGQIVRYFKSTSAIAINQLLGNENKRLWQRNYYEHIIRNDEELANIRFYIEHNPEQWDKDQYFV
jgi:putative transposase